MTKDPVVVPRSMTLKDFFYERVYQDYYQLYPVVSFGKFAGCVTVADASRVPKDDWNNLTVGAVTVPCSPETAILSEKSVAKALSVMQRTGNERLLVLEGDELAGVITLDAILKRMASKEAIKGNDPMADQPEADGQGH